MCLKPDLSRVIYYDKFEDGRLVIKQGHPGISYYFIVSGSVVVERQDYDPFLKEYYTQKVGELNAGDSFGELSLLHNTKRAASIFCRGTCEFLRIDRDDFNEVLRYSHQREWEMRGTILRSHPVFKGWSPRELNLANMHSKTKSYPPNTIIISESKQKPDRVFFIATGICTVVRRLQLVKKQVSAKKYKYQLPPIDGKNLSSPVPPKTDVFKRNSIKDPLLAKEKSALAIGEKQIEDRYFTVFSLGPGDYFNVGENMNGLYVISVGRVEVVQMGTLAFARHSDRLRNLQEMKSTYLSKLPTFMSTYKKYILDRKWQCYKKNVVHQVIDKRTRKQTVSLRDVPGLIYDDEVCYNDPMDIV